MPCSKKNVSCNSLKGKTRNRTLRASRQQWIVMCQPIGIFIGRQMVEALRDCPVSSPFTHPCKQDWQTKSRGARLPLFASMLGCNRL